MNSIEPFLPFLTSNRHYKIIIAPNSPATPMTAQTHHPSPATGVTLPAAFFVALAFAPVELDAAVSFPVVVLAVTEAGGPLTSVAVAEPAAVHPAPFPE